MRHNLLQTAASGLAQQCANPGEKLLNTERRGDVVVGPAIQSQHLPALAGAYRQHHDRYLRPDPQLARHCLAVHGWQTEIEYHQIGLAERRLHEAIAARRNSCRFLFHQGLWMQR